MHLPAIDSYTLLCLEWLIGSVLVGALGLLVLIYSDSLPNFIHRCVKYGKSAEAHVNDKLRLLELPKRYFFHFYSIALGFYLTLLSKALSMYYNINLFQSSSESPSSATLPSSNFLISTLNYFTKYERIASG